MSENEARANARMAREFLEPPGDVAPISGESGVFFAICAEPCGPERNAAHLKAG